MLSSADELYTWSDKEGNIFYGKHSPVSFPGAKKISMAPISKYTTQVTVKPDPISPEIINSITELSSENNNLNSKANISEKTTLAKLKNNEGIQSVLERVENKTNLTIEPVRINYNKNGHIEYCIVSIANHTDDLASDVYVSFFFPDQMTVQAVGPSNIQPSKKAFYKIAEDLLPLNIWGETKIEGDVKNLQPEVIIEKK